VAERVGEVGELADGVVLEAVVIEAAIAPRVNAAALGIVLVIERQPGAVGVADQPMAVVPAERVGVIERVMDRGEVVVAVIGEADEGAPLGESPGGAA
jgi:hypothetical protein